MKKLGRLRKEAIDCCNFRGHKMKRFEHCRPYAGIMWGHAYSECEICGRSVHINARPEPNGIEIGGEAVAVDCESED